MEIRRKVSDVKTFKTVRSLEGQCILGWGERMGGPARSTGGGIANAHIVGEHPGSDCVGECITGHKANTVAIGRSASSGAFVGDVSTVLIRGGNHLPGAAIGE